MRTFSETQPKIEQETDRFPLKAGLNIIITGYVKQPSKKCPEGIAHINGYDAHDVSKTILKFWYCGKAVVHKMDNMSKSVGIDSGLFREGIHTATILVKGEKGDYIDLVDPA